MEQRRHKPMGMHGGGPITHSHGYVMALLQWHKIYKLGEDELHRPPSGGLNKES